MSNISLQQFNNAMNKIPSSIADLGFSEETSKNIQNISSRHNADSSSSDIAAVTGYTLVGLVPIKRFIQALQEDARLDEKTAKNVAHDVRAEIFAPVAKELAAMQEQAETEWEKAHSAAEASPETEEGKPEKKASPMQPPTPKDESVVSEVFPAPEVDDKKFDDGLEKPEEK